jgi:hypothetical protein
MKKMIMTLAIAISTLSAFAGEENVTPKVLDAFKTKFKTAKEVEWTASFCVLILHIFLLKNFKRHYSGLRNLIVTLA